MVAELLVRHIQMLVIGAEPSKSGCSSYASIVFLRSLCETLLLVLYCFSGKLTDGKKKVIYRGETHAVLTVAAPHKHGHHSVVVGMKHPQDQRGLHLCMWPSTFVGMVAQIVKGRASQIHIRRISHRGGLANIQGWRANARTMSCSDISCLASRTCSSRMMRLEHSAATLTIIRVTNEQPDPARSNVHVQGAPWTRSSAVVEMVHGTVTQERLCFSIRTAYAFALATTYLGMSAVLKGIPPCFICTTLSTIGLQFPS